MEIADLIGPLIGGCFVGVFLIVGIILIVKSIKDKKKAEASGAWPSTTGTVVESTIKEHSSYDTDDHTQRTTFSPYVKYTYTVMGTAYESHKLAFGAAQSGSYKFAQDLIAAYPAGATVAVYYDPNNPAEAVLMRKSGSSKVMLILGIVFVAVSLCIGGIGAVGLVLSMVE